MWGEGKGEGGACRGLLWWGGRGREEGEGGGESGKGGGGRGEGRIGRGLRWWGGLEFLSLATMKVLIITQMGRR